MLVSSSKFKVNCRAFPHRGIFHLAVQVSWTQALCCWLLNTTQMCPWWASVHDCTSACMLSHIRSCQNKPGLDRRFHYDFDFIACAGSWSRSEIPLLPHCLCDDNNDDLHCVHACVCTCLCFYKETKKSSSSTLFSNTSLSPADVFSQGNMRAKITFMQPTWHYCE